MRTRMKILFPMLGLVAFFVLAGFVIGFALNFGNNSTLSYFYLSNGVEASVYGNYYVGNNCYQMMSGENDHVTFSGGEEDYEQSLQPTESQINLQCSDGYVVFEYEFVNNSNTKDFCVNLFATPVMNNMTVTYAYSYEKIENFNEVDSFVFNMAPVLAGEGNSIFVYIKVAIKNLANDASYSGTFSFRFYTCDAYEVTLMNEGDETCRFYAIYGEYYNSVEVVEIEGKEFLGYFTGENGTGEQIIDEDGFFNDIWNIPANTTLYAYYV